MVVDERHTLDNTHEIKEKEKFDEINEFESELEDAQKENVDKKEEIVIDNDVTESESDFCKVPKK